MFPLQILRIDALARMHYPQCSFSFLWIVYLECRMSVLMVELAQMQIVVLG